jgi:hypothetical protein
VCACGSCKPHCGLRIHILSCSRTASSSMSLATTARLSAAVNSLSPVDRARARASAASRRASSPTGVCATDAVLPPPAPLFAAPACSGPAPEPCCAARAAAAFLLDLSFRTSSTHDKKQASTSDLQI